MKLWSDFYNLILPEVQGCPYIVVDNALRQAAITFCQQSLSWKYDHPDVALVPAIDSYPFDPPAGAEVYTITYAEYNGREVETKVAVPDMWNWRNQTGVPQYVMAGAMLGVVPVPDMSGALKLEVALQPAGDSAGIDDTIYNNDREAIIHGALSRLMLSPKKPYANPTLAVYHDQQCNIKTGRAGTRTARRSTREPLRTKVMRRMY